MPELSVCGSIDRSDYVGERREWNRRCGFSSILSRLVGTRVIDTDYAGPMWVMCILTH